MKQTHRSNETRLDVQVKKGVYYRCPACGQEVDRTDWLAVSRHHQHVLHPYLFPQLQGSKDRTR